MSFNTAVQFLSEYRKDRIKALNNETRQSWSTSQLEDLDSLASDIFSSNEENDAWTALFNESKSKPVNTNSLEGLQLKIAFLAGCRRDMGIMFMAGKSPRRLRMPLDHDRFERSRLSFNRYKMDKMKELFDELSKR